MSHPVSLIDHLAYMMDSANAQTYEGKQRAIEIVKNMESERIDRHLAVERDNATLQSQAGDDQREIRLLKCNIHNRYQQIAGLNAEHIKLRTEASALRTELKMLPIHNARLEEKNAQLHAELMDIKAAHASEKFDWIKKNKCLENRLKAFTDDGPNAAKRSRVDGSGAKP
jgi:hypothetical protein